MTEHFWTQRPTARRPAGRIAVLVTCGAIAGTLAACGRAAPASGDVRPGGAEGDALVVVATDDDFEPPVLKAKAGEDVTVEVRNEGDRAHNLVIDELDLSTGTIEPGQAATATFTAPDESVGFVCTFHRGMDGEIRVAAS